MGKTLCRLGTDYRSSFVYTEANYLFNTFAVAVLCVQDSPSDCNMFMLRCSLRLRFINDQNLFSIQLSFVSSNEDT